MPPFDLEADSQLFLTTMPVDGPADTLSVADYQSKFDEISAIRQAAKNDRSMSNDEKRQIAVEFTAARRDLQAGKRLWPLQPRPRRLPPDIASCSAGDYIRWVVFAAP